MRFSEYMNEWLYSNDGYYSKYRIIGKKGDFYTAVSSSQFFGGTIGKYIVDSIVQEKFSNNITICEIGAHKGYLIADIIQFIYTLKPKLINSLKFAIIEKYDNLIKIQQQYLKESFGDKINIEFYNSLEKFKSDETFFIANEIFDAFPTNLFYKGKIATVNLDNNHKIEFKTEDKTISEIAKKMKIDKGEIPTNYRSFGDSLKKSSKKFEFMTFDYGDNFARSDFSVRIYSKHEVHPLFDENIEIKDFFKNSDITYDVNFEYLAEEFEAIDINKISFLTQSKALVEMGIIDLLDMLQKNADFKTYTAELNRAKILLDPAFMGERFKMIKFSFDSKQSKNK
jgi:SAM-dependent MidA family methyltransferase